MDKVYNVVVVGEQGCGKTSFVRKMSEIFPSEISTEKPNVYGAVYKQDGYHDRHYHFHDCGTGGIFYPINALAIIIMYDISDDYEKQKRNIKLWMDRMNGMYLP